jgi:hypothetical protein
MNSVSTPTLLSTTRTRSSTVETDSEYVTNSSVVIGTHDLQLRAKHIVSWDPTTYSSTANTWHSIMGTHDL